MNVADLGTTPAITGDLATHATAKPSKLHEAAQQFESLMLNEMLKSAKESSSSSGWMDSEGDSAGESAMEMAQGQFANALAKSGGLGLAKMIEKSVSAPTPHKAG